MDAKQAIYIVNTHLAQFNRGTIDITHYDRFIEALSIVSGLANTFHAHIAQTIDSRNITRRVYKGQLVDFSLFMDVAFTPESAKQFGLHVDIDALTDTTP